MDCGHGAHRPFRSGSMGEPKLQSLQHETTALLVVLVRGYLEYLCARAGILVRLNEHARVASAEQGYPEYPNAYALELWCMDNPAKPSVRIGRLLICYEGDLIFSTTGDIRAWRFAPTDLESCLCTIRLVLTGSGDLP